MKNNLKQKPQKRQNNIEHNQNQKNTHTHTNFRKY